MSISHSVVQSRCGAMDFLISQHSTMCVLSLRIRAGQYCYLGITIDTKVTIHDTYTVRYLKSLLSIMLHIPSGNLFTVIALSYVMLSCSHLLKG